MGTERRSMIIKDSEKRTSAFHEAGHTIVARLLKNTDPVHKVTIIPRGRALGLTQQLPLEDRQMVTKSFAEAQIAILMGGRIAEEIIFNELSTGAGQDIQSATDMARRMVCDWGMSKELGPLFYGRKEEAIFLGREIAQSQDFSEQTAEKIDKEVAEIVNTQYKRARNLLETNLPSLNGLADKLLVDEVLNGEEIDVILTENSAQGEVTFSA